MNSRLRLTERKGQGAFEYIMNYGWAIIIILIIGVSMWYLGVFNIEPSPAATFSGFSVIKPIMTMVILTTGGNFSGMFINGASYEITVTGIDITNEDGAKCNITAGKVAVPSIKEFIIMGENCTVAGLHRDGDAFVLSVGINFTGTIGTASISRTESGKLRGLYGAGAYKSPFKTCAEYGAEVGGFACCNLASETCSAGGSRKDSSDCGFCCVGAGVTCVTTTTTTTTTTTSVTTTTIIGSGSVCVCGSCYNCGADDNICPSDFGVACADPNC